MKNEKINENRVSLNEKEPENGRIAIDDSDLDSIAGGTTSETIQKTGGVIKKVASFFKYFMI